MKGDKLTERQRAFVVEYICDLNATQAAIRAGYNQRTARQTGAENLSKPVIQTEIMAAMAEREKRTGITADRVLAELAAIAFADTTHAIEIKNGQVVVKDTAGLSSDTRRAIAEIKQTTSLNGGSLSLKFHDKKGALELLGRHLGIFDYQEADDIPKPTQVIINVVDGRRTEREGEELKRCPQN